MPLSKKQEEEFKDYVSEIEHLSRMVEFNYINGFPEAKEKAKEQEDTIPFARSVNFSGDIPKVPSGLPANRGLGRRVG